MSAVALCCGAQCPYISLHVVHILASKTQSLEGVRSQLLPLNGRTGYGYIYLHTK